MDMEILVPLLFIGSVALLSAYALRLHARTRQQALEIVREALARDVPLEPQTIEAIATGYRPRGVDLRRGLLFVAVAAALLIFSFVAQPAPGDILRGLAAFPGLIGLTYVAFYIFKVGAP
ncbi:MAG: hypothetical protein AAFN74_18280 [Myxococcota bacterium]